MAVSFSCVGASVTRCTGFCRYCSAATNINYVMGSKADVKYLESVDKVCYDQLKTDWNAVEKLLLNDPQIVNDKKKDSIHFDLWGADSSSNLLMLKDMTEHLTIISKRLGYDNISFSDSTNGIGLMRNEVMDWHYNNNVKIQLSHDGLGQWIRTNDIEPLLFDNTKLLITEGILSAINCTTTFFNYDICKNVIFFTEYLKTIFPDIYDDKKTATEKETEIFKRLYIKINHCYANTTPTKAKNTEGYFNGKKYDQLVNTEIGDMNIRNDIDRSERYGIFEMAHVLDDYMHSYRLIIAELKKNQVYMLPFKSYFTEQLKRFRLLKSHDEVTGGCRAYQRYKHKVGNPKSWRNFNFAFDTLGRYSSCNLLDADHDVKSPGGPQPEMCKGCRYEYSSECNACGSEDISTMTQCDYLYRFNQLLEEMAVGTY